MNYMLLLPDDMHLLRAETEDFDKGGASLALEDVEDADNEDVDVPIVKKKFFKDFHLKTGLLDGVMEKGWESPYPIQEASIPIALQGKDIFGRAANGTGKTGAYCIPVLERIKVDEKKIQAVIVLPSHDLVLDTENLCKKLGERLQLKVIVSTDRTKLDEDFKRLKCNATVHLVIATPKRILELLVYSVYDVSKCKMLVLDEADKLLLQDSEGNWDKIVKHFPKDRQIMLFSATITLPMKQFMGKHMHTFSSPDSFIDIVDSVGDDVSATAEADSEGDEEPCFPIAGPGQDGRAKNGTGKTGACFIPEDAEDAERKLNEHPPHDPN